MQEAFLAEAEKRVHQPLRQVMVPPSLKGVMGTIPGFISGSNIFGIKIITVFPGNFPTLAPHQGVVALFDANSGTMRALVDATAITAVRTAAASAVATDILARKNAKTLGIYGYGEQAHRHVTAISAVRDISSVIVWGRNYERACAFASTLATSLGLTVTAAPTPEGPAQCDIVCTVTSAKEPFLNPEWLRPGHHLNLVGSGTPDASEAGPAVVRAGRFFVDYVPSASVLAGEFVKAKNAGLADERDIAGSVGDVIAHRVDGRLNESDITIFKSLGMAAEDLTAAHYVVEKAKQLDIGQVVEM